MTNESNIIKTVCKALGYTYNQLAEQIGYKTDTVNSSASRGNISVPMKKAIELYLKTIKREDLAEQTQEEIINEENLVKKVCDEFGIIQKELADLLDVSLPTVSRWSANSQEIPKMAVASLNGMLENKLLKEKLYSIEIIEELKVFDFTSLSYKQLKQIKSVIDSQEV